MLVMHYVDVKKMPSKILLQYAIIEQPFQESLSSIKN